MSSPPDSLLAVTSQNMHQQESSHRCDLTSDLPGVIHCLVIRSGDTKTGDILAMDPHDSNDSDQSTVQFQHNLAAIIIMASVNMRSVSSSAISTH